MIQREQVKYEERQSLFNNVKNNIHIILSIYLMVNTDLVFYFGNMVTFHCELESLETQVTLSL